MVVRRAIPVVVAAVRRRARSRQECHIIQIIQRGARPAFPIVICIGAVRKNKKVASKRVNAVILSFVIDGH